MLVVLQGLNDDVILHKVDVDDICGMARMLAASCSIEMVTAEASQLAGYFQALTSNVQVTASISTSSL